MQPQPPPPPGQGNSLLDELQKHITQTFSTLDAKLRDFKNQNDILEGNILQANESLTKTFGRTQVAVKGLRLSLVESLPTISALGGNLESAFKIIQDTSEQLGTNRILLGETTKDLYAVGQAFDISEYYMGTYVKYFHDAGIDVGLIRDRMEETLNIARLVGANSKAVFQNVANSLDQLNKYGFKDGVEGLTRMAAKAVSMRFDMSHIFNFAEKVFSPEGAIEAVATFQRLGLAVGDLADPFRLMYLASEDVEGLADQVVKMTNKFSYFDEKSKEFKIFPNAKRDMRDLATQMGTTFDELQKITFAQTRLNYLSSQFKFNANVKETDKQLVANLAQYSKEKGDFVIKVNREEKLVTQLSEEDLEVLRARPETVEDVARAQLDETKLIKATVDGIFDLMRGIVVGAKPTQDLAEVVRASKEAINKAATGASGKVGGGIKKVDEFYLAIPIAIKKITDDYNKGTINFTEYIDKMQKASESYVGSLQDLSKKIINYDFSGSIDPKNNPLIGKDNLIANALGSVITALENGATKLDQMFQNQTFSRPTSQQISNQSTSSMNQTNPNAQVLATTNVKPEEIVPKLFASNNQNVSFSPINGNIELKVVTEDGTKVDLTNQIVSSVEFQRKVVSLVSGLMQNQNYNNLPNSTTIS